MRFWEKRPLIPSFQSCRVTLFGMSIWRPKKKALDKRNFSQDRPLFSKYNCLELYRRHVWAPSEPVISRDLCVLVGSKEIASLQSQSQWGQLWLDPLQYKRYLRSGEWNNSLYFPSFSKVSGEIISWISTTELATLSQIAFKSVKENKHFLCVAVPALGMCPTITARISRTHPGGTLGCHCFGQSILKHTHEHTHTYTNSVEASQQFSQILIWDDNLRKNDYWIMYLMIISTLSCKCSQFASAGALLQDTFSRWGVNYEHSLKEFSVYHFLKIRVQVSRAHTQGQHLSLMKAEIFGPVEKAMNVWLAFNLKPHKT